MYKILKTSPAQYWIPTEDEWYKAAFYDPTLNGGSGGYWSYATKSNSVPTPVTANTVGDGSAGPSGNFANFNRTSDWNGEDGNVTTVGTNGGPSYYGTFDQSGNTYEWNDAIISSTNRGIRGGYWLNLLANDEFRLSTTGRNSSNPSLDNSAIGFRISTINNLLALSNFVDVANANNSNDSTGYGSVSYNYKIGKYEVTNSEYAEFLNAVGLVDIYGLYVTNMNSSRAGIARTITGYSSSPHSCLTIDFLPVLNSGNPPNPSAPANISSYSNNGTVSYNYHIGKYEITNSQYCLFLNSIAKTDTNNVYNSSMQITRSGVSGSYSYSPTIGNSNKPVCFVSMYDMFRFSNWLHNGCPAGNQNASTTEDGAYDLTLPLPVRKSGAKFWIPNIDEWYKAAFYSQSLNSGSGGYYLYPTSSDTLIASIPPGTNNSANFDTVAGSATEVGAYTNATSPYGAYDMAGNISERLDTRIDSNLVFLATINSGSNSVAVNDGQLLASSFVVGGSITGSGIPADTTITSISGSNLIISNNATLTNNSASLTTTSRGYFHSVGNWNFSGFGTTPISGELFNSSASTITFSFATAVGENNRVGFRVAASLPTYSYSVNTNWNNKPIVFINWFRAARYCNWLHNGKPSGFQNNLTTEDGAYKLNGTNNGIIDKTNFNVYFDNTNFRMHG